MRALRVSVLLSTVAVLAGCPSGDKCKDKMCPTGQSCNPADGMCVNGNGGNGGTGGNGGSGGSGGTGGSVDAGPPPIAQNEFCTRFADARCAQAVRCKLIEASSLATCKALVAEACPSNFSLNGVTAGNSSYDGKAAAQCAADYATVDCDDSDAPTACSDIVTGGRGRAGTPCELSAECQADAGFYCALNDFTPCDVCQARAGVGAFCAFDVDIRCQAGLRCDEAGNDGGICRAPGGNGADCDIVPCQQDAGLFCQNVTDGGPDRCRPQLGMGDRCVLSFNCQPDLLCLPGDGGSFCNPRRGADQPCTSTTQCQSGLYCPPVGVTPRTCRQLGADGTPCSSGVECAANYCNRDPMEEPSVDAGRRTCGFLALGTTCYALRDCGPGNLCKDWIPQRPDAGAVAGTCAVADPDGGACTNQATRYEDSCANIRATCLDGRCVETPGYSRRLGQTCDQVRMFNPPQCGNDTHCNYADPITFEGVCVAALADGAACNEDVECQVGSYCDVGGTDTCIRYARAGEVCDNSDGPFCTGLTTCNPPIGGSADAGSTCHPLSGVGQPCRPSSGPSCFAAYCEPDAGVCAARQSNGAACNGPGQCASNRCENPDGGFDDEQCLMACF